MDDGPINTSRLSLVQKSMLVAMLVIVAIVMSASSVAWNIYSQTQNNIDSRLQSTLLSSVNQVKQTFHEYKTITGYWADEDSILHIAHALTAPTAMFLQVETKNSLNSVLEPTLKEHGFRDFKLLNKQGLVLTSKSGHDVGDSVLWTDAMARAWDGIPQISLPFKSSRMWKDYDGWVMSGAPTMFVMAPIQDSRQQTLALLVFEFDPESVFKPAFDINQFGESGHTYAVSKDGSLLSHIKHHDELYSLDLLDHAIRHPELNVKLTVPTTNGLTSNIGQTFTEMAQSISLQQSGSNVEGYIDFRGKRVVGAWLWDNHLQMGFATETGIDEAYVLFTKIRNSIIYGVIGISIIVILAMVVYIRSTKQIIRSHQQRDAIINTAGEGILAIETDGTISMANPQASSMFGYDENILVGMNLDALISVNDHQPPQSYLLNTQFLEARTFNFTDNLEGIKKDGSHFPLALTISELEVGDKAYFMGLARDITHQVKQNHDLITAKEEAEHAKERAESANRAKSQFLSKMSHELRTPLNAILGFSQLLLMDKLTEDQSESVEMISSSGQHLLNLINDILDVSQIESGNMTVSLEQVNLMKLVQEITPLIETQLSPLNLSLTVEAYDDDIIWVEADQLKLKQVLLNLLSNAVKYNRQDGFISIIVSKHRQDKVLLSIQDGGAGLTEQQMASLFEPFNRLGRENSDVEGTGIGLVISRELLKLMDGNLLVDSVEEHGSTFTVELPSATPVYKIESSENDVTTINSYQGRGSSLAINVLYIEDNPANMALVKQLLARHPNYVLHEAGTAELGLIIARHEPIDIILMDINLPGMDGFEALETLKKEGLTEKITVIGVSANALVSEVERAYQAGFEYYLTKPIDFRALIESLEDISEKIRFPK